MSSLSAIWGELDQKNKGGLAFKGSYQVGEHSSAQEHHVSPSGRVLDAHLEFLGQISKD